MANEQPTQKTPKKGNFFLQYILPVIIGVVGGWFLNAYMMPENKDAKALIKIQADQVEATREGFNKLADAIQRNNMADIINNANMVGSQLNGLSSTTNSFLTEYKLPVVKRDSILKVTVDPNRVIDTGKKVAIVPPPIVPLSTEFKIKVGEKNTIKIDEANFIAIVSENEDNGTLNVIFNGNYGNHFAIGGIYNMIPIGKVQKRLLFKGKDESKSNYVFLILDPVK